MKAILVLTLIFYFFSSISFFIYIYTKKQIGLKVGFSFFGLAFASLLIYIGISDYKYKTFALASNENLPVLMVVLISALFYGFSLKYKQLKELGSIFAPINVFLIALALPNTETSQPLNNNIWFYLHVIFSALAYVFIIGATVVSVIYLLTEKDLKNKKLNSFWVSKFSSSLYILQEVEYKSNVLAFVFLSFALVASSIWSSVYVGKHWLWDIKQIALSILWLFYGFLLHLRIIKNQKGKKASYLTLTGSFIALIVFWFIKHPVY
jgi:ABC-type transport system involved in cytochrome c biogenesis permease subunit